MSKFYKFFVLVFFVLFSTSAFSQLTVTTGVSAATLASTLAGPGVTYLNPVLTCPAVAEGTFTNGPLSTPVINMTSGILLTNGHAAACSGPEGPLISFTSGGGTDPAMAPFLPSGTAIVDACILEMDVVAKSDTISFNYQFGSEEYRNAVCSIYTDVFAFFISGPGIVGAPNMALVPGTNIPVEINSVNNGTPGTVGGANIANCNALGPGSPFTAYYINNAGGLYLSYRGYTKKFRAFHRVTPCDTYHLKMSIVDAGNALYDSGVWLEGGSLVTNSYHFDHTAPIGATINGTPNAIVKGCSPATVSIDGSFANTFPDTLHLAFGGTAVNGYDVSTVPGSIVMPAGSTTVSFNVSGIPTPAAGTRSFTIYLLTACGIADSVTINLIDTPSAHILTSDTAVCLGTSFQIQAAGTPGLSYSWSPTTGLSSGTVMNPVCTPTGSIVYTMTATLPGSGCPPIVRTISVTLSSIAVSILTPDTSICKGQSATIRVSGSPTNSYIWTPGTGLSNATVESPVASPATTTTYTLNATDASGLCPFRGEVTVTVLDATAAILTPDTNICLGKSIQIMVTGTPGLNYDWTPATGLDNPMLMEPTASPLVSTTYTMIASVPGSLCADTQRINIGIIVLPADAGEYPQVCLSQPIQLNALPVGPNYSYLWTGPSFISTSSSPLVTDMRPATAGVYTLTVTDNTTGCVGRDTAILSVTTAAPPLLNVTPSQTIPYGSSIRLNADNAVYYMWMPNDGSLSNNNINDPVARPLQNTTYTVYGMDVYGCVDSAKVTIYLTYGNIFIPNAFTPNGDGNNDVFKVGLLGYYTIVEFSIYNRWGQRVYHALDGENQGWDGTYLGVPQDLGVYNYYIIVNHPGGQPEAFKGTLTLVR